MRTEFEAWDEAQRILVEVRGNPDASTEQQQAAVRRAGETMGALLRRIVVVVDTMRRVIDRNVDQVSLAIDAGDQDLFRIISDILARLYDLEERLRLIEVRK